MTRIAKFIMALLFVPVTALAWPTKPINIVVPFPPGGLTDQIIRKIAPELEKHLQMPVIVKNQPGGNHMVALNAVLAHQYDDHTFVVADGGLASGGYWINPSVVNNFRMISILGSAPMVFSGGTGATLHNLHLQTQSKKSVTVASTGSDSIQYLWLASLTNTPDMIPVYYKGGHPAMSDLAGGHVDYAIMSLTLTQQFAQTGKVVPLLISSAKRHALFPDLATFREFGWQGDPGEYWIGILSPAMSDASNMQKFTAAIDVIVRNGNLKQLETTGMVFESKSGLKAHQFFQDELNRFERIRHRVLQEQ